MWVLAQLSGRAQGLVGFTLSLLDLLPHSGAFSLRRCEMCCCSHRRVGRCAVASNSAPGCASISTDGQPPTNVFSRAFGWERLNSLFTHTTCLSRQASCMRCRAGLAVQADGFRAERSGKAKLQGRTTPIHLPRTATPYQWHGQGLVPTRVKRERELKLPSYSSSCHRSHPRHHTIQYQPCGPVAKPGEVRWRLSCQRRFPGAARSSARLFAWLAMEGGGVGVWG